MKTIIITGSTGSLGRAAAQALAEKGDVTLVLVGRNPAKLEAVKATLNGKNVNVSTVEMNLSNIASVARAVEQIKRDYPKLDALINVAAVYKGQKTTTAEGYETMFVTNHLGPFALTTGLLPLIKATPGAKVLTVAAPSSTKVDFESLNGEKRFSALSAFGASKMMNLLFALRLAQQFEGSGQASMVFHPGLIKSDLMQEAPAVIRGLLRLVSASPQKVARAIASLIMEGHVSAQNGKFYNSKGKELKAAAFAYDTANQQKLWEVSKNMIQPYPF
jgi:retinol dehydrogenase 12